MGFRRRARERAVQALYQLDTEGFPPPEQVSEAAPPDALRRFWASFEAPEPDVRRLADPLVIGVLAHLPELDRVVEESSLHWRLDRMARVDRNILRLAVYELAQRPEVPTKVCINEAIEIARRYGAEDSGAFINGVLDRIAQNLRGPIEPGATAEQEDPPG